MSHVLLSSGPDTDYGALENPYAVWLRNVPTWLDEDRWLNKNLFSLLWHVYCRFYDEISGWYDVDKEKSYCFKNKQDSNWIGVRYGWAIVTFRSKKSRNKFLENDERHYVQENERAPYEKLKVSPWYEKPNKKQNNLKEKPVNKVPLYKADLEKEIQDSSKPYGDFTPDYVRDSGQRSSKSLTPESEIVRKSNIDSSSGKKSSQLRLERHICVHKLLLNVCGLTENIVDKATSIFSLCFFQINFLLLHLVKICSPHNCFFIY